MSGLLASQLSLGWSAFWAMAFDTAFAPYFYESRLRAVGQDSCSTW